MIVCTAAAIPDQDWRHRIFSDSRLFMEPSDQSRKKDFLLSSAFGEDAQGPSEAPPPIFSPDEVVCERYRVIRFIARGGMGEVYEVEDEELHSRIALKTIAPSRASSKHQLNRFKQEIQLARKGEPSQRLPRV